MFVRNIYSINSEAKLENLQLLRIVKRIICLDTA